MTKPAPKLSAIVVVGSQRTRAQRSVDALNRQANAEEIEVVVVDTASPASFPDLAMSGPASHVYLRVPVGSSWGAARCEGMRTASAPILAFIEDHCFAGPRWAEALIEAYKGEWASVGYGFTNANPQTHLSRVSMFLDYGLWELPTKSRQVDLLPGNNVSYRKDALSQLSVDVTQLLEIDFNLHVALRAQNRRLYTAADAVASHQNFEHLYGSLAANFAYAKVLAFNRAKANSWGLPRRIIYACGTPIVSSPIRLWRLVNSFRFSPEKSEKLASLLKALPVLLVTFAWSGVGEALGYLLGEGESRKALFYWEVEAERTRGAHAD